MNRQVIFITLVDLALKRFFNTLIVFPSLNRTSDRTIKHCPQLILLHRIYTFHYYVFLFHKGELLRLVLPFLGLVIISPFLLR